MTQNHMLISKPVAQGGTLGGFTASLPLLGAYLARREARQNWLNRTAPLCKLALQPSRQNRAASVFSLAARNIRRSDRTKTDGTFSGSGFPNPRKVV